MAGCSQDFVLDAHPLGSIIQKLLLNLLADTSGGVDVEGRLVVLVSG